MTFNDGRDGTTSDTPMAEALRSAGVDTEAARLKVLARDCLKQTRGNVERALEVFVGRLNRRLLLRLVGRDAVNLKVLRLLATEAAVLYPPKPAVKPAAATLTAAAPRRQPNPPRSDAATRIGQQARNRTSALDTVMIDDIAIGRCSLGAVRSKARRLGSKHAFVARLLDHLRHVPDAEIVAAHITPDDADKLFEKAKTDG